MNVSLVMFKADGTRRDFPISKSRVILGRTNQCDLRIPLSSVSRQHCELRITDRGVRLRDLGSSNGTYHNHNRVKEAVLAAGDEIGIGKVTFTVVINGKPARIEPVHTGLDKTSVSQASVDMSQTIEAIPMLDDDELGNLPGDNDASLVAIPMEDSEAPIVQPSPDDSDELPVLEADDLLLDDDDDDR